MRNARRIILNAGVGWEQETDHIASATTTGRQASFKNQTEGVAVRIRNNAWTLLLTGGPMAPFGPGVPG